MRVFDTPFGKALGKLQRRAGRHWRWLLLLPALPLAAAALLAVMVYWDLPDITPLANPRTTLSIEVPDWQGEMHPFLVGPKNPHWTPLDNFPADLKWAVIVAEDANFYEHAGIDVAALKESLKTDLERKRSPRGASTITQQLAKNLFLSRDRSLVRKLRELVIARRMEAELSKGRILELYLNVVELGPLVYGMGAGARYHFDLSVTILSPGEAAFLAAMLPGPRVAYNPQTRPQRVRQRAAHLVRLLGLRGVLNDSEIAWALADIEQLGGPR